MCPTHVLAFMSQHLCISGSSARSMSPDPCLNIHIYISQELLQDPCLRFMSYSILIIRFCGPAQAKRKFWPPETRFAWPCAGKTVRPRSAGAFRAGETQILSSGDAFCVALRRENSPTECFAQAKRKFWTAEMHFLWPCAGETQILSSGDAFCVALRRENSPTECFAQAKRKFWTAEMHFLWPCAGETQILTSGDASSVQMKWIHEDSQPDEQNRHGATARRKKKFRATVSRRRNANFDLRSGVFCGPAQWKTRGTKKSTST